MKNYIDIKNFIRENKNDHQKIEEFLLKNNILFKKYIYFPKGYFMPIFFNDNIICYVIWHNKKIKENLVDDKKIKSIVYNQEFKYFKDFKNINKIIMEK